MADPTGKLVLIVDDASLIRLYYRDALQRAGYTVEEALNGLEALEKLLVLTPDLLIVDVNMPKMDGMTFLSVLRGKELPNSAVPVLVTTTEAVPRDVAIARNAGANFFLVKPITQFDLVDHVNMMCGAPP